MKVLYFIGFCLVIAGCNLAEWNQQRLDKKLARNGIQSDTLQTEHSDIFYYEGGTGPTVLLIHGFGGDAQITWEKTMLELVPDFHILAPDLLWFGKSKSESKPQLTSQVEMVLTLILERNIDKCSIGGVSYGGFVTLGAVQQRPDLFSKMFIVDSPGMTYDTAFLDTLCRQLKVDTPEEIFVPTNREEVSRLFDLAFHKDHNMNKGVLEDAYELYFSQHHRELEQLIQTLPGEKEQFMTNKLDTYPPSIVIWGANDEVFPVSEGQKLADYLSSTRFVIIPDAGHAPMIENSDAFTNALIKFLKGINH